MTLFSYVFEKDISTVKTGQLHSEISTSTITIALDSINSVGNSISIDFKAELSSGELATLSGVVNSHSPDPNFDPPVHITAGYDPTTQKVEPHLPYRYAGDGKLRVLSSHKPVIPGKEAYNFFASAGDAEDGTMGEGNMFMLSVCSGTTVSGVDLHFSHDLDPMELVYVFGGGIAWENAGWGDNVELQIRSSPTAVVPRVVATGISLPVDYNLDGERIIYVGSDQGDYALGGYPKFVPNYNNTGHWNLNTQTLTPIPVSGTGVFDWYVSDQHVGSYVKNLAVYGTNYQYLLIDGTESAPLPYGAYFRILAHNFSDTDWRFWGLMKMYRQRLK